MSKFKFASAMIQEWEETGRRMQTEAKIRADERAKTLAEVTELFNEMRPRLATNISEFADRLEQLKEQK